MADTGDLDWALETARAGESRGFHALFRRFGPTVVGYLRSRNVSDPDGIANDVFFHAFRGLDGFVGDADRFRAWLFTIAHNAAIDDARKRRRRVGTTPIENAPEPATTHDAVDDEADARFAQARVKTMLERLSPDQRDVLLLRIVGDLSVAETAEILGKTYEGVKALQRRGLSALRREISGVEGVPR